MYLNFIEINSNLLRILKLIEIVVIWEEKINIYRVAHFLSYLCQVYYAKKKGKSSSREITK